MSLEILEEYCVACGMCVAHCKNGAIKEGDEVYSIDPERCTECVGWHEWPRCADACFLSAPQPDPERRESHEQLLERWKKLHPKKTPRVN